MRLEIGAPVPDDSPKNKFVIEVSLMHGDGDHYDSFDIEFYVTEEQKAIEAINTIAEIAKIESGYENKYEKVKGFNDLGWPGDVTENSDYYPAAYADHKIFYYDENGTKYFAYLEE